LPKPKANEEKTPLSYFPFFEGVRGSSCEKQKIIKKNQ